MESTYHHAPLPDLSLHDSLEGKQIDAREVVTGWLAQLNACFDSKHFDDLGDLFIEDCWWRDIIALSWDWTTKHGQHSIGQYLSSSPNSLSTFEGITTGGLQPSCLDMGGMFWVQGGFTFKHPHGRGKGFVRLANVGKSEWKAWTVFTQLLELNTQGGHNTEKSRGMPPPNERSDDAHTNIDLQVLVIGAGQAGLTFGARLKSMGIQYLLLDKGDRVGDPWRNRYRSVSLHTPRYTDYYPFLKTPDTWPTYIGQDRVADFMEHYSQLMEIDIMLKSTVTKVEYDEMSRKYHVEASTPTGVRKFTTKHVVLATGLFSEKPIIPDIPGKETFNGQLYHSKEHRSASLIPSLHNKKVVIVGTGSSGHDIAHDYVSHGAKDVTMIQRGDIISISTKSQEDFVLSLWNTEGISTEEADLIGNSLPTPIVRTMSVGLTQMMCANDKDMIDGLKKAGLGVRTGTDGVGLAEYQLVRGGQFYIDQGANQMIIDGQIKIRRSEGGVRSLHAGGMILADGTNVDADIIVLATGFYRTIVDIKSIMGEDVADKIGNITHLDEEQERIATWRPTGMPGFWYMTGSFLWCRQYSLVLALQIAAIEKGLNDAHYDKN